MKQVVVFALLVLATLVFSWPNQPQSCGTPIYYNSYNGTPNGHSSDYPPAAQVNGTWSLHVPTSWTPNTNYTIMIDGTNVQPLYNNTKQNRVRGFVLAAYDSNLRSYGVWSDSIGYVATYNCNDTGAGNPTQPGSFPLMVTPITGLTPSWSIKSGSVGGHTPLLDQTKVYKLLSVTWTSPPNAIALTFGGIVVSDMTVNYDMPTYQSTGVGPTSAAGPTSVPATVPATTPGSDATTVAAATVLTSLAVASCL